MKERIVVDNRIYVTKEYFIEIENVITANSPNTKYIKEQVPENFADLLTLCKNLKDVDIEEADDLDVARIIIHNADLIYFEDEFLMIAGFKKLEIKPEKMWQIIKNLIGE